MEATRTYDRCIFDSATIREAVRVFEALTRGRVSKPLEVWVRGITTATDAWTFDDDDEFFAAYDDGFADASFSLAPGGLLHSATDDALDVHAFRYHNALSTRVHVKRPTRGDIERVLRVFGERADAVRVSEQPPPEPPPRIFIGHGRSLLWDQLKDHLHEQHGYEVEAYETGTRAGHTIRDILERMMKRSTFAVIVLTAEDEQAAGELRARQNVVHEAGLFQGRLGFDRVIVAIEEGVERFSNLEGIHQLRFGKDNIREIYGDVLATLRREFPGR